MQFPDISKEFQKNSKEFPKSSTKIPKKFPPNCLQTTWKYLAHTYRSKSFSSLFFMKFRYYEDKIHKGTVDLDVNMLSQKWFIPFVNR